MKKYKRPFSVLLIATLLLSLIPKTNVFSSPLTFAQAIPDENLRYAIFSSLDDTDAFWNRAFKLENEPFNPNFLKEITEVYADRRDIYSLEGLQYCTNLTTLNLDYNNISDLTILESLTQLSTLHLSNNNICNLKPLSSLKNLTDLDLTDQYISLPEEDASYSITITSPLINSDGQTIYYQDITKINEGGYFIEPYQIQWINSNKDTCLSFDFDACVIIGNAHTTFSGTVTKNIKSKPNAITIPDKNLRKSILNALNKNDNYIITKDDMSSITTLSTDECIYSLEGLQYCTNLTYLNASTNYISDISPISNLTKLRYLDLSDNELSDISPLAHLSQLNKLYLWQNLISDITPLKSLTQLLELNLNCNDISDISPLSNITLLNKLELSTNKIINISPISKLTNLLELDLSSQEIELSEEETYKSLTIKNPIINLKGNPINNITNISNNGVLSNDFSHLNWTGINKDSKLSFNFNTTVNIGKASTDFSGLVTKKIKYKSETANIPDETLKAILLENLKKDSQYTITKDDLESITSLDLDNKNIKSLEGLQYCLNLTSLSLRNTNIVDFKIFNSLPNLKTLDLSNNNLNNISSLITLKSLEKLNLDNNQITDISALNSLSNLKIVSINNQDIKLQSEISNGTVCVTNPLIDINKLPVTNINKINNSGLFSTEYNTITWSGLDEDLILAFNFSSEHNNNSTNVSFSGKVTKQITFKSKIIDIPDESLKNTLLTNLNKSSQDELTEKDLECITSLNANGKGIASLKGLEYCKNITSISLPNNNIEDLSPIKNLRKLTNLNLANNAISNLSFLNSLSNLKILNLSGNNIFDLTPLSSLKKLKILNTSNQEINLSEEHYDGYISIKNPLINSKNQPITNFISISHNGKFDNNTNTISWSNLQQDTNLNFTFKEITKVNNIDTTFSGKVIKKVILDIIPAPITDRHLNKALLKVLNKSDDYEITTKDLSSISSLNLNDCDINYLNGLEFCRNLRFLSIKNNPIEDLSPLTNLTNLDTLSINGCNVSSLDSLSKLTNLKYLDCSNNYISELIPINSLTSLVTLYASNNSINSLDNLANLRNLVQLNLKDNAITNINSLSTLNNLEVLNLSSNYINDINVLSSLTNLTFLSLSENEIEDISPLSNLIKLTNLNLYSNKIKNIDPLKSLTNLKILYINQNPIEDFSALNSLPNLTNVTK